MARSTGRVRSACWIAIRSNGLWTPPHLRLLHGLCLRLAGLRISLVRKTGGEDPAKPDKMLHRSPREAAGQSARQSRAAQQSYDGSTKTPLTPNNDERQVQTAGQTWFKHDPKSSKTQSHNAPKMIQQWSQNDPAWSNHHPNIVQTSSKNDPTMMQT